MRYLGALPAGICPVIYLIYAWILWNFPLHGETLHKLSKDYSSLFVGMEKDVAGASTAKVPPPQVVPASARENETVVKEEVKHEPSAAVEVAAS